MGATKEEVDNTGAVNETWSSDVLLKLLDLLFDGTLSTEVVLRILSDASGNQQGASTRATTDTIGGGTEIFLHLDTHFPPENEVFVGHNTKNRNAPEKTS